MHFNPSSTTFLLLSCQLFLSSLAKELPRHGSRLKRSALWTREPDLPNPKETVLLSFAVASARLDDMEEALLRVSDPMSAQYGQHWTQSEVSAHFSPTPEAVQHVVDWLDRSEVPSQAIAISSDRGWIYANTTVLGAEKLLDATYHLYRRSGSSERHIACLNYSLPEAVRQYVDFVTPTTDLGVGTKFGKRHAGLEHSSWEAGSNAQLSESLQRRQLDDPNTCSSITTPACLQNMYKIPVANSSHANNTLGVYEPAWASWLPADLDIFFKYFRPNLVGQRPPIIPINGGYWQDEIQGLSFNAEANLDIQVAMSLTAPERVVNFQVGDMWHPGTYNSLMAAFDESYYSSLNSTLDGVYPNFRPGGYNKSADCGTVQPSQVLSISYAANEINFTPEYLTRQCLEFLKLGLMGVSVIVSAADCGPAGQQCTCIDPDTGEEGEDIDRGNFNPTTPASCPYVTVVGGTALPPGAPVSAPEVAWRHNITYLNATIPRTSGGGFSNIFPAPSWQLDAIEQYATRESERLSLLRGRYNPAGRGVPDLSANAANFATVRNGTLRRIHGTSASTPVVASIITLINGKRLSKGKGPVGFLNPTLYANAHMLNDVVSGSNRGCGVDAFHATTGWDPVTGLGTPDYERMEEFFLQLP